MNLKSKILFCFLFIHLGFVTHSLCAQTKQSNNIIKQLKDFYHLGKSDSVLSIADKALEKLKAKDSKDSLLYANLYLYQFIGLHKTNKSLKNISSIDRGISYCPQSQTGDSLKAVFYNKKAYLENELGSSMKSYKSILSSLKLLERLPNPSPGFIMGAYLLLSSQSAYFGNFEQAKHYMRLAEDIYNKNKTEIDANTLELNGNHHRLGVILKYRKIYMLWKFKNSNDRLPIINTMTELEKMHNRPDFHKEERIYYSTALNHLGDWLISYKHDSLTTEKDIQLGLKYLLKSHDLVKNKKYQGTLWAIKYNIAKGYIKGGLLEKADSTMADLFNGISKTDGRLPFFYAQKALIKVKKNQKDSALIYFNKSIQKIHSGKDSLKTNYNNFKPSKSYSHTRLLLRINEELNNYYPKDTIVQKRIDKLYYLALQQFENSYLNINFNKQQNDQLRKIIKGVLKSKRIGSLDGNLPQKTILNKFEIFKNQLAWKKFYESRYTNTIPELDSIKQRNITLASLLSKAKVIKTIPQRDSIQRLIQRHNSYKKKLFPQLELLSDFKFSIEKLQRDLTSKDLILKYILLENKIAIYKISKNSFNVDLIPWANKEKSKLNSFIKKARNRDYSFELASHFGQLLIPKIDTNITHLIINPDEMLFKLPFEILTINGKFAIELYNFSYTSNLGFINYKSEKDYTSENIHIYAPSYSNTINQPDIKSKPNFLKGASNEAESISKLFPSKLFNGKNLTKSKFIKTAGNGKVLHLAMHAEINKNFPELSRLLFSNNLKKEEEHLYLEELYGLSLNADLAILSACNTGSGLYRNGNLESFQRAFTFAGVPATVVSLWEVPDLATEQIMLFFYENLKKGQPKSEALRNAKLTYKSKHANSKLSAPYFWAGFVVYGNDSPITSSNSFFLLYIIGMALIVFILFLKNKKPKSNALGFF
jgi:CHAT domain-containing protein/RNase P subunit RPR2